MTVIAFDIESRLFWESFLNSEGFIHGQTKDGKNTFLQVLFLDKKGMSGGELKRCNVDFLFVDKVKAKELVQGPVPGRIETSYEPKRFLFANKNNRKAEIHIYPAGKCLIVGLEPSAFTGWSDNRQVPTGLSLPGGNVFETLNRTNKLGLRRYVHEAFLEAFSRRDFPLVTLWKFPKGKRSVFNIRIDVDPEKGLEEGIVQEHIQSTYRQLSNYDNCVTYALNFYRRRPNYGSLFEGLSAGADVQSHNFFHYLFPDPRRNRHSINLAHQLLEKAGRSVSGFISPEYFWHDHTAEIVEELGCLYAGSFGYDYQNYPYRPVINGRMANYFEMPVDPLVQGYINRALAGDEERLNARKSLVRTAINDLGRPVFFYEHPMAVGPDQRILQSLLEEGLSQSDVLPITQTGFADWLFGREQILKGISVSESGDERFEVRLGEQLTGKLDDYALAIQRQKNQVTVIPLKNMTRQIADPGKGVLYERKEPESPYIGYPVETGLRIPVSWWNNKRHRRRLIDNNRLYRRYESLGYLEA